MKSNCESPKVHDFSEEDELSEMNSARFVSKFKNPNALDKYEFLENFTRGTKIQSEEIGEVPCADVDAVDSDCDCDGNAFSYTPMDAEVDSATRGMSGLDDVLQCSLTSHEQGFQFISDTLQHRHSFKLESLQDESVDAIKDADGSKNDSSPSTSSDIVDGRASANDPSSNHRLGGWNMGNRTTEVSICPDYVVYHEKQCTESVLIFSSSCIALEGSTDQGTFSFQWGLDDIITIESLWFGRLEVAMVKIHTIPKDSVQAGNAQGTSGIEELKFAVVDSNWYEKQEEIISLDARHSKLWNIVVDSDIGMNEKALVGQSGVCLPKRYYPNFDEPFEEVVYPKGDSDAVSISKRDVDLLQPDTFVNDTIIDFYIKYLKNKIQPMERHRFHFFNSFFFRKLADLDKDPSSACQGRAAFQRVRKWTRKVDIFQKDYVFIPVNFNYHWSLIVLCHPGEVARFQDEHVEKSLKVPCILHMDSIRGSHTGLKDLVQSYLWEEWKEKHKETSEDIRSKFSNLRFVPLELPQQQNSYDCGLFLLHYVELFLEEAPVNFSPFKITKLSNFLNVDWFPPAEASLKRVLIQRLIYELLENHSRENSPATNGEKRFPSKCPENIYQNETGLDFVSEKCIPKSCDGNLLCSQGGLQIEIGQLPIPSQRTSQCASDSGLVLREFFETGVTSGSFLDKQYQAFDRIDSFNEFKNAMSAMEVDVEAGFQRLGEGTSEACAVSYSSIDLGAETSWNQEVPVHQTEHNNTDSSPGTSLSDPGNSLRARNINNTPLPEDLGVEENLDRERSPSLENREGSTESFVSASEMLDVPDSQDPNHVLDENGDEDPHKSCQTILPGLADQDHNMQENRDDVCDDLNKLTGVGAAKRPRLTPFP